MTAELRDGVWYVTTHMIGPSDVGGEESWEFCQRTGRVLGHVVME